MESNEAARQLADVDRLKARTVNESLQGHRWAVPALVMATILFFSSYEIQSRLDAPWLGIVAPVAWTAFIVFWVRWLRSDNRARPKWNGGTGLSWRSYVAAWVVLLIAANLVMLIGASVSWILAGLLMALLVAGGGGILQRLGGK